MTYPADLNHTYAFVMVRLENGGGFQYTISRRDLTALTVAAGVPGSAAGGAGQAWNTQTFSTDAAAMLEAQNLIISGQVT